MKNFIVSCEKKKTTGRYCNMWKNEIEKLD